MNRQSKLTTTWAIALAFIMLASIQIEARPRFDDKVTVPTSQPKAATRTAKSYACPMHPEVKSTKKGKCPKCKMDLQLVRETASSAEKESQVASAAVGEIVTAAVTLRPQIQAMFWVQAKNSRSPMLKCWTRKAMPFISTAI